MPAVAERKIFNRQHLVPSFFEKMIVIKNGAPSRDVMAPTGRADPLPILLEQVSARSKRRLPPRRDTGIEYL